MRVIADLLQRIGCDLLFLNINTKIRYLISLCRIFGERLKCGITFVKKRQTI